MKDLLKKVNYFFSSLIRNREASPELSKIINLYLDDPETDMLILDKYHCVLQHPTYNRLCLWISNYPYCYGTVECDHSNLTAKDWENYKKLNLILGKKLPDRKTVYRLNEAGRLITNPTLTQTQKQEIMEEIQKVVKSCPVIIKNKHV